MNVAQFAVRYSTGLAAHVSDRSERSLRAAYEIGREAVQTEITLLDVAAVHSEAVAHLFEQDDATITDVLAPAADFLVEVLSPFEMVRRGLGEAQDAADNERRQAAILRHLSTLLADESLVAPDEETVQEIIRLIAEQVLDVTHARRCQVALIVRGKRVAVAVDSAEAAEVPVHAQSSAGPHARTTARTCVVGLNGSRLGWIDVTPRDGDTLRSTDADVVRQVAGLTAAMLERADGYS